MIAVKMDLNELWIQYKKTGKLKLRHELIMHYIWLVKYVLNDMKLPLNTILEDGDFLNIGIMGLHDAVERYELDRGVKFESYALARIKGTIQDELRKLDWLSRTARKKAHEFMQAGDALRREVGREVTTEEIRNKLNLSHDEYNSYLVAAAAAKAYLSLSEPSQIISDEEKDVFDDIPDPSSLLTLETLENEERIAFINVSLKNLNERKRLIITLYYFENLTFKEIGKILNVSESRVCQIHSQVLGDLKKKLIEFDNA